MNSKNFLLTRSKRPVQETTSSLLADWQARHSQAMRHPQTLFEQAFVQMMQGWAGYAIAHQTAYGGHILSDGVLGECWTAIGEGLLGLLSGELGRLDGGTLDRTLRQWLDPSEADGAAPGEEEEAADFVDALSSRNGGLR